MMKTKPYTKNLPQALVELPFLLLTGGVLYWGLEICFRGRSHWTMVLCGAICFLAIYQINERLSQIPSVFRALLGACLITAVELAVGCVCNLWLGWQIWDYSDQPFHFHGQICLPFFAIWFLLCIPAGALCRWIGRVVFYSHATEH